MTRPHDGLPVDTPLAAVGPQSHEPSIYASVPNPLRIDDDGSVGVCRRRELDAFGELAATWRGRPYIAPRSNTAKHTVVRDSQNQVGRYGAWSCAGGDERIEFFDPCDAVHSNGVHGRFRYASDIVVGRRAHPQRWGYDSGSRDVRSRFHSPPR